MIGTGSLIYIVKNDGGIHLSAWHWALIVAAILLVMVILRRISGDRHPFRGTLFSVVCGWLVLALLNLCAVWTGTSLPVSILSLSASAFLGIPGITAMLLLQLIL